MEFKSLHLEEILLLKSGQATYFILMISSNKLNALKLIEYIRIFLHQSKTQKEINVKINISIISPTN